MASTFPPGKYENRDICLRLLTHAQEVLRHKSGGKKLEITARGILSYNMGCYFYFQGQWDVAESLFLKSVQISQQEKGADHPSTLTIIGNLALTYAKQGRWDKAEKLQVQVMETRKTKLGADHPDTLMSMVNLAFIWKSQGRYEEALATMESCALLSRNSYLS